MLNDKPKRIRVFFNFARASDADLLSQGHSAVTGLTGNARYMNPPVQPVSLKDALDNFAIAIGNALDGGKKARLERECRREEVIKMLRALSHYVELACQDDMGTFLSSGFLPRALERSAPRPLDPTSIGRIEYGNSGELLIKLRATPQALSYELRYAVKGPDGAPGAWTNIAIPRVRTPTVCSGLTPGVVYLFQVRALGRLGHNEWSDSLTKMAT